MPGLCGVLNCTGAPDFEEVKEAVRDTSAGRLSYVGMAAYDSIKFKHAWHHKEQWNVTSGKVIGKIHQTPDASIYNSKMDPQADKPHCEYLPEKMAEIVGRTTKFCDIMSLSPPDGLFMDHMKKGLATICKNAQDKKNEKPVIVRMMFGNIVGMPVNCDKIIRKLTKDLPAANVNIWVGAWRKGVSWNHAKLIAVDGRYLHTGGHNMWDYHYLRNDPVHDVSLELEGRVAHDGHLFANKQWDFIIKKQSGIIGQIAEKIPDNLPLIWKTRVIVSEWPVGIAKEFPETYYPSIAPRYDILENSSPVISIGRLGTLTRVSRPSDDAILAMIHSAKKIIRLSLQDLGPIKIPNTSKALPGLKWPKPIMMALAKAIWEREVDVEIVLSNPGSIPGSLAFTDACYGNGWSCVDVASEIIKRIGKQFNDVDDSVLRTRVEDNLRVCFIRHNKKSTYQKGMNIGNHSKFFIVDDLATYIGSQNLYMCDLAEWGVVIDSEDETKKIMEEFWKPLWDASYIPDEDCDVQKVMDGMKIERDGDDINMLTAEGRKRKEEAAKMQAMRGSIGDNNTQYYQPETA